MLCRIFAIKGNALGCPKTGGRVMLAVISWQCDYGMHVKAMYETDGMTTVRCPQSFCNITHIVTVRSPNFGSNPIRHRQTGGDMKSPASSCVEATRLRGHFRAE